MQSLHRTRIDALTPYKDKKMQASNLYSPNNLHKYPHLSFSVPVAEAL